MKSNNILPYSGEYFMYDQSKESLNHFLKAVITRVVSLAWQPLDNIWVFILVHRGDILCLILPGSAIPNL